jgi:hypothetical protein
VAAGEKGGDADGDGVKAYRLRPGPTLTGSGDDGVRGGEDEVTVLLLMAGPGWHVARGGRSIVLFQYLHVRVYQWDSEKQ